MRIEQAIYFLHASNATQFEVLANLIHSELIITLLAEKWVRAAPLGVLTE